MTESAAVDVFVLDAHAIYRRGLVASLELLEEVRAVHDAENAEQAWQGDDLERSDVVIVDCAIAKSDEFISAVRRTTTARVIVFASDQNAAEAEAVDAIQAGAVGFLRKDMLTLEALRAAVQGAISGAGVVSLDLLGVLARRGMTPTSEDESMPLHPLSDREQQVLRLIADGLPTREIARRLSYSERTVKNILHDVVTKLRVRSRSQAVAHAVRDGLI